MPLIQAHEFRHTSHAYPAGRDSRTEGACAARERTSRGARTARTNRERP